MTREEAINKATQIVDGLSQPVLNDRGYRADGWKPPTLHERTQAILALADFLVAPEPHLKRPVSAGEITASRLPS